MSIVLRALLSTVVFAAAHFFSYWMIFLQVVPESPQQLAWSLSLATGCLAAAFAWYNLSSPNCGLSGAIACSALTFGSLGLVGGFIGPVVLFPEAQQGPLLGLFVTGPLGFLAGGTFAAFKWKRQHRHYG